MATIRKRGDYQWQAQIRKRGYPEQVCTFNTKAEAEAWARRVESEMDRGAFAVGQAEADRTTLGEALERYWIEIASKKRYPEKERWQINRWLKHPHSKCFLGRLRGADLAKYRDDRRAQGKAENTIRIELAVISHLYEIARKEWGMEGLPNPIKNIRMPKGSRERDRRLEAGEYERIAAALDGSENIWARPVFDFAIETALRQGMLFKLKWSWVDLERRIIHVPPECRGADNKCVPATLPLSTRAAAVLQALPRSIDGRVFPTSQNAAVCVWKRALRRLGIDNLRWHDLRHEAASRLFEKGLNPFEVAAITGHKTLNTLRRYTHLRAENLLEKLG